MLSLPANTMIYLYAHPTDMRKSFDGLSGIARSELGKDPTDGSMFLFINRRRDRIKILHFDDGGYWSLVGNDGVNPEIVTPGEASMNFAG